MQLDALLKSNLSVGPANLPEALAREPGKANQVKGYGARTVESGKMDVQALHELSGALEKFTQGLGVSLKLHVHEGSGTIQAEILEASGKKVLRQIPPDNILDLAVSIRKFSGLLARRAL